MNLWTSHGDALRRFVRARVRRETDVDDILQNVFAKAHAALPSIRDPEAWLYQVARREVADHYRARRTQPLAAEPAVEAPEESASAALAACLPSLMGALSPRDRAALQGAAQDAGLSPSGAKSRVQRARLRLKDELLACCAVELDGRGLPAAYTPRRACAC